MSCAKERFDMLKTPGCCIPGNQGHPDLLMFMQKRDGGERHSWLISIKSPGVAQFESASYSFPGTLCDVIEQFSPQNDLKFTFTLGVASHQIIFYEDCMQVLKNNWKETYPCLWDTNTHKQHGDSFTRILISRAIMRECILRAGIPEEQVNTVEKMASAAERII